MRAAVATWSFALATAIRPAALPTRVISIALLSTALLATTGCTRPEPPPPASDAPPPPQPLTVPATSAASAAPAWRQTLPKRDATFAQGASVWAAVPRPGSELCALAIYRVDAVGDGVLSLVDELGQRVDGIPFALAHPVRASNDLAEGAVALFYTWTTPGWLGRVTRAAPGEPPHVAYDLAGTTRTVQTRHAELPRTGIEPLAFVAFPKSGATSLGQIIALDESRAWILAGSGHVEAHPRDALEPVAAGGALEVGTTVRAFRWATGFERGIITEVLEPNLRYRVALAGNRSATDYFFTALVPDERSRAR